MSIILPKRQFIAFPVKFITIDNYWAQFRRKYAGIEPTVTVSSQQVP